MGVITTGDNSLFLTIFTNSQLYSLEKNIYNSAANVIATITKVTSNLYIVLYIIVS